MYDLATIRAAAARIANGTATPTDYVIAHAARAYASVKVGA